MPTITLSWTDLALCGLTAGLIVLIIGRSSSSTTIKRVSEGNTTSKKSSKSRNKKGNTVPTNNPSHNPPPPKITTKTSPHLPQSPHVTPIVQQSIDSQIDFPPLPTSNKDDNKKNQTNRQQQAPFAERHKQPVAQTIVDDMIDKDVEKPLQIARVMHLVGPQSHAPQDPLSPISDAEEGWEKVPDSKRSRHTDNSSHLKSNPNTASPSPHHTSTDQKLSKRQRQNAKRKQAVKSLKAVEEADRLRQLAAHKRDQERLKINSSTHASSKSSGKLISGGMKSTIGQDGRLIWE